MLICMNGQCGEPTLEERTDEETEDVYYICTTCNFRMRKDMYRKEVAEGKTDYLRLCQERVHKEERD